MQSLSTAATGLSAQQQKIDIIANNIANLNTTAYKTSSAVFADTYYTIMENPDQNADETELARGTGAKLASTSMDFSQGKAVATGNALDLMIEGNAFFRLLDGAGNFAYTKDGSFSVSDEVDGSYLVNSQGFYVLDENDERIRVPEGRFTVQSDGSIADSGIRIGIYAFENTGGLEPRGNNLFYEGVSSGQALETAEYRLIQNSLEGSNVDLSTELTQLIQAQRIFSLASRALQTADEMEGLANNIRR
ncbi:MAG: flagellar hook-basal body protein [Oscillospiraceae bacterium]|jgi:flagellar basal-body rod protein FlgG